jgi:DNA ligase-associated metallophosphoesterase
VKSAVRVRLGGAAFTLLAARAAVWEDRRWLIVADAHFGKAATFRARGVPVPRGTTSDTLERLATLIESTRPTTLVFLGDLFHAAEAHATGTLAAMRRWRAGHADLEVVLVEGNHDLNAGAPPADLGIRIEQEPWSVGPVAFCHHPQFVAGAHALAGHLHPAVRISGRADDGVRLPCFWLREGLSVLPAFGSFTGASRIDREDGDRVVAIGDGTLYEVPSLRSAA